MADPRLDPDAFAHEQELALIPGEPRDSTFPEDARQWIAVYTELVSFTRRLLEREGAAGETGAADASRLQARLRRLISRLGFWRLRLSDLVGFEVDEQRRTLSYQGTTVSLTRREAQLLRFLAEHPGKTFTASQLVLHAWHAPDLSDEELRTYIVRLRRWIASLDLPCVLATEPRHGYTFRFTG
jgi:Transcriptional regulatory protein, C terminal